MRPTTFNRSSRISPEATVLPLLCFLALGTQAAAAAPDLESLRQGLSFHCSYDAGADADFARGDRRVHTSIRTTPLEIEPGLSAEHVTIEETGGRYGGAMRFGRPSQQILLYGDGENLGYRARDWSGTISLWLSLDPDQDLTPGLYCDPIHITDATKWDDASLWLTFARSPPWRLGFGAMPDLEAWNPEGKKWGEIPASQRPHLVAKDAPFGQDRWTHIVVTFADFNRGDKNGLAHLYLEGELYGEISGFSQTFTWDPAKAAIQMGLNYVGLIDDFAIFDRALSAAEVLALHELPSGVAVLHP